MANEHTIRVSARGEFGQLENGLKNLQKDLKSVLGEIDKGARKGGLFDDTQLRALSVYRNRFKATMDEINREMNKQNDTIDQLHRRRQNSSKAEQQAIDEEIKRREKALDVLRKQIRYVEDLYQKRNKEAEAYKRAQAEASKASSGGGSPSAGGSYGGGGGSSIMGGAMAKILGVGKFMVGLAGIGGIASMASQSYNLAYASQVTPMNLSQRIRGHGYTGSAKNMWDEIGGIGRNNSMGYTSAESWQFQDMYSRKAGALNQNGLENAMLFGRAYGLDVGETAGGLSTNRALGGASSAAAFSNMIAASVAKSGMTPRILEVLETSNGLLESMNTSLKDGGSKQILAYQTTLDKIGLEKGMMRLTGQQGANVISGMGGIFNPGQENPWKWMGIQALQQYNPKKYGKMGLYDLETNFESGLENTDNVAAMAKYLRGKSGGDENTMKRMLQRWLQDGGYNATKQQVNDLYSATDGFTSFDSGKMKGVMGTLEAGDGTAKYQERMGQLGQSILDTNARFEKQLENLGQPLLAAVQGIKEGVTSLLETLDTEGIEGILNDIKKFLEDNVTPALIGGAVAAALAGQKFLGGGGGGGKGGAPRIPFLPLIGKGAMGTLGTIGTIFGTIFGGKQLMDTFSSGNAAKHNKLAKEAGYKGDVSWFDRFLAESFEGLGGDPKKFYKLFSDETRDKFMGKMDKFFNTLFPDKPRTKKEKEALANIGDGKTPDGKHYRHLDYMDYLNPGNWGKGTRNPKEKNMWQKMFGGEMTLDPTKSQKAIDDLSKLGNSGLVNITNLTELGKQKLADLAAQGVIKLTEGKDMMTTTISGFSDEGKKELTMMAKSGAISISGFQADGTAKITVMSEEAQKKLEDLKKNGLIDIGGFKKESTVQITELSKDGAKKLQKLQADGNLSLTSMDLNTSNKLTDMNTTTGKKFGEIKKEHEKFVDKTTGKDGIFTAWADDIKSIFEDLVKWWKDNMPSWLGGGGDSNDGADGNPYTITSGGGKKLDSRVLGYKNQLAAAGAKYGISDTNLLMAIMNQESHGAGNNPMQVNGVHNVKDSIDKGVAYFSKVLKKAGGNVELALQAYNMGEGYIDYVNKNYGGKTSKASATAFSNMQKAKHGYRIYGDNDYVSHVLQYYPTAATAGAHGSWYFDDWQKRVTSHFGSAEGFRKSPHSGLDINGEQGDAVQALRGGKIAFINMDDGGKYDADGKKNTRAGGTEVGIKMPDGKTYMYAHLSQVNPEILKAFKDGKSVGVDTGDWIGNVGGTPGIAGSGNSTTGSHLHVGLFDKNGNRIDPEGWMKGLNAGDSATDMYGNDVISGSTVKKVEVEVTLKGEVEKLNGATEAALTSLIEKVIKNYEAQKLLLNPSM